MTDEFQIIPYARALKPYFKTLNREWLEKYFTVEPYEATLLENCESEIINKGGCIFFGIIDEQAVGTYALLAPVNECIELGKMAITETYQGKGYGQKLLQHSLKTAKNLGYEKVLLYSSRKLENSIYLYRKFGFKEVPNEDSPYARGDIKMLLKL